MRTRSYTRCINRCRTYVDDLARPALTRALAVALAPHGINVNVIAPGNTETPMNERIRNAPENAAIRATIAERTPSKRLFADPNEIAGAALFLASDDAQSMYGSMVLMDQGISAGY